MVPLDSPYSPSALYPVLSHHPQYPNPPSYHALDDDYSSATCVPSLIPPGMDPAHVDMRTFYPYQPNEVKHRRRTTRAQLKVLEDVYTRDTKPNANLRKKLAQELDMTPRGVQVWFQNRRAKTKQQRKKAEAVLSAGTHQPSPNEHTGDGAEPTSPPASPSEEVSPEEPSPEPQVSPAADHALPKTDTSWPPSQNVQLHTSPGFLAPPDLYAMRRPSLPTLVNGSLAAPDMYSVSAHGLQRRGVDRRRSVDHNANASTHALRLAGHPYAHAVSVANGNGSSPHGMYDPSLAHVQEDAAASWQSVTQLPYAHRRPAFPPRHSVPSLFPYHTPQSQPAAPMSQPGGANQHGPAMQQPGADRSPPPPNITQALAPRRSGDASNAPSTLVHPAAIIPHHPRISSQLALPNVNIVRNQHRAFAYSSRPVGAPPPGPLPAPNFSFGDAAGSQGPSPLEASPASSANSSTANLHAPDGAEDAGGDLVYREARDEEESEYSQFSRFGSIASVGGSESSWTSAGSAPQGISVAVVPVGAGAGGAQVEWEEGWTWETAGNWKDGFQYGDRRDSCASGHFLELFNDLDVNSAHESPVPPHVAQPHASQAAHNLSHHSSGDHIPSEGLASDAGKAETRNMQEQYPSPTSTISAGTHHSQGYESPEHSQNHVQNMNQGNHVDVFQDAHSESYHDAVHARGSARSSTSELAYALQGHPEDMSHSQNQSQAPADLSTDNSRLQYPDYSGAEPAGLDGAPDASGSSAGYAYSQQPHDASYTPTYDGSSVQLQYPGTPIYGQNAIQLSHMCVPANVAGGQYLALGYPQFP